MLLRGLKAGMPSVNLQEVRKYLIMLVVAIVALDAAILGVYYGMHIAERPARTQQTFVAVWVVLTLFVVTTIMRKLRRARVRQS
jgi:predicted membrane channel-forming protein YqfA (hemolysin III family)